MSLFAIECRYCGHSWESFKRPGEWTRCSICGDKNFIARNTHDKVDYYVGTKPFKKEDKKDNDDEDIDNFNNDGGFPYTIKEYD